MKRNRTRERTASAVAIFNFDGIGCFLPKGHFRHSKNSQKYQHPAAALSQKRSRVDHGTIVNVLNQSCGFVCEEVIRANRNEQAMASHESRIGRHVLCRGSYLLYRVCIMTAFFHLQIFPPTFCRETNDHNHDGLIATSPEETEKRNPPIHNS